MVERSDCTMLVHKLDYGLVGSWACVCLAPQLKQGEAWLENAKLIAHSLAGTFKDALNKTFDEFCDECGIGPPHDDQDRAIQTSRSERPWRCDRCNHLNNRPVTRQESVNKTD